MFIGRKNAKRYSAVKRTHESLIYKQKISVSLSLSLKIMHSMSSSFERLVTDGVVYHDPNALLSPYTHFNVSLIQKRFCSLSNRCLPWSPHKTATTVGNVTGCLNNDHREETSRTAQTTRSFGNLGTGGDKFLSLSRLQRAPFVLLPRIHKLIVPTLINSLKVTVVRKPFSIR